MKKNYISRLKQYDARTSFKDKQSLYTRKFIKTCYADSLNKENQDPNISTKKNQSHSRQSNNKVKAWHTTQTRCSEKKKGSTIQHEEIEHRQVSQFKEIFINPYECEFNKNHNGKVLYVAEDNRRKVICCEQCSLKFLNKTLFFDRESSNSPVISERKKSILANIKLQSVELQRYIQKKQAQQTQKCNNYYNCLLYQLTEQQKDTIAYIQSFFQDNRDRLSQRMAQIQSLITEMDQCDLKCPKAIKFCSPLKAQDTQIALNIAVIHADEGLLEKAKHQMSKFDLRNLGYLNCPSKQLEKPYIPSHNNANIQHQSNEQSLTCNEELLEPKFAKNINNQLDISFEQNADFIIGADCQIIEDIQPQSYGISPSFKYF